MSAQTPQRYDCMGDCRYDMVESTDGNKDWIPLYRRPEKASAVQREWHFDRYRNGRLMAQGVKVVRAATEEEAREIARALLYLDGNLPSDELRLSQNGDGSTP